MNLVNLIVFPYKTGKIAFLLKYLQSTCLIPPITKHLSLTSEVTGCEEKVTSPAFDSINLQSTDPDTSLKGHSTESW